MKRCGCDDPDVKISWVRRPPLASISWGAMATSELTSPLALLTIGGNLVTLYVAWSAHRLALRANSHDRQVEVRRQAARVAAWVDGDSHSVKVINASNLPVVT
jgi:hypothetical protein